MLYFYLFLSIGVSFLCSLFEAVLLSLSPAYVASVVESGKSSALLLQKVKSELDNSLSAILTLNTVAHTIGAAGVGAEIQKIYGNEFVAIGSAILTILVLVLSEIIPKTIGASYSKSLAFMTARGIQSFIFITYPFVVTFKQLAKLLGSKGHGVVVTRDELIHTAEMGQQGGNLTQEEVKIIKNLIRFKMINVKDIMTPRTVVFAFQKDTQVQDVFREHKMLSFSRIPIYEKDLDVITGMVTRYSIVRSQADGHPEKKLSELAIPIHGVPDNITVGQVFDIFVERGEHLFTVQDEHGGLAGLISLEDVIETLLGIEITDEFDSNEDMRAYATKLWERRRKRQAEDSSGEEG